MEESITDTDWIDFFHRNFFMLPQRRSILFKWQHMRKSANAPRLANAFEAFVHMLMYQSVSIHFMSDQLLVFGEQYPIMFDWLSDDDLAFMARVFEHRHTIFKIAREHSDRQYDYFGLRIENEDLLLPCITRKQLVRDFVWLVADTWEPFYVTELVVALQWILIARPTDVFLSHLAEGLQGRCNLKEVPCWGLTLWDTHPEESYK